MALFVDLSEDDAESPQHHGTKLVSAAERERPKDQKTVTQDSRDEERQLTRNAATEALGCYP
jgi:hypothetical protein